MKKNSFIFLIIIYFFSLNNVYALDPEVFVQSTVNRASKVLSEEISKEKKNVEIKTNS